MNLTLNVQFDIENLIIEEIKIFFQRHKYNNEIDFEIKKGFNSLSFRRINNKEGLLFV